MKKNKHKHLIKNAVLSKTQILKDMGLFKTVVLGAALYGAYKYATKKDVNGRSMVDDLKDKAPEFMDKAKRFKDDMEMKYTNRADTYTDVKQP